MGTANLRLVNHAVRRAHCPAHEVSIFASIGVPARPRTGPVNLAKMA